MQLTLPGLTLPAARPLVPIEAAMVLLDRHEDEIIHAIESGTLAWAWDIRSPDAARREIRIWRDSLLALATGRRESDQDHGDVLTYVLPNRDIRSTELQRLWSCSSTHIHTLIDGGSIRPTNNPAIRSGPNSWVLIGRHSIEEFLRARRVI